MVSLMVVPLPVPGGSMKARYHAPDELGTVTGAAYDRATGDIHVVVV